MRRYTREDVISFLEGLDRALDTPVQLIVIGGVAVFARVAHARATADIDAIGLTESGREALRRAYSTLASSGTPVIPLGTEAAAVAQLPDGYEQRCEPWLEHLTRLSLRLLERHDLVLSKIERWHEGDEAQVRELADEQALGIEVLVERYLDMRFTAAWNPDRVDGNFIECIGVLFGEIERDRVRARLARHRRRY